MKTSTRPGVNAALLQAAIAAAERDWHLFPVSPGRKTPALHGSDTCPRTGPCTGGHQGWEQRATSDLDRIRACWGSGTPYNLGLATGPSGLVVIDLDTPKPGEQPPSEWRAEGVRDGADVLAVLCERAGEPLPIDTYSVATPSGGLHLYFHHPRTGPQLRNTQSTLGWGIDTRAHGGYVLAAGSIVNDRAYRVVHDGPVAPLPEWLATRLTPRELPVQEPVSVALPADRRGRYLHAAITRQVEHIATAARGSRNATLYTSAVALGQLVAGGALDEDTVRQTLTRAGLEAGLRTREVERTIRSGLRAGAARPRNLAA